MEFCVTLKPTIRCGRPCYLLSEQPGRDSSLSETTIDTNFTAFQREEQISEISKTTPVKMSYKKTNPLPQSKPDDVVLSIAAFETGWMQIGASMAIDGLKGQLHGTSWRFFMEHAPTNTKFWFDLGVAHVRLSCRVESDMSIFQTN